MKTGKSSFASSVKRLVSSRITYLHKGMMMFLEEMDLDFMKEEVSQLEINLSY